MKNTMKASEGVSLEDAQEGTLLGLWRRCPDGYRWRSDYKAAGKGGGLGPWLMPTSSEHQDYPMLRSKSLLADFLRIGSADTPADILKFAGRYGMLGIPQPVVAPDRSIGFAETLSDWSAEVRELRHLAETLSAVEVLRNEQHEGYDKVNVAEHLLKTRLVQAGDGNVVYHIVAQRSAHREVFVATLQLCEVCGNDQHDEHHWWRRISVDIGGAGRTSSETRWTRAKLLNVAQTILATLINERLRGHVNVVMLENGDGALIRHAPDSLLAVLYLQLALRASGNEGPEAQCVHCRMPFFRSRRNKRYCTKQCRENAGYHRRKDRSE